MKFEQHESVQDRIGKNGRTHRSNAREPVIIIVLRGKKPSQGPHVAQDAVESVFQREGNVGTRSDSNDTAFGGGDDPAMENFVHRRRISG